RIILTMERQGAPFPAVNRPDVFVAAMDRSCQEEAFSILFDLRRNGLNADMDYLGRSLKSQMKYAGKTGCRLVVIVGGDELKRGAAAVRNMAGGTQVEMPLYGLARGIKEIIEG
ncbi:MAG: His/Gly/Thr/Pro-type tRNA ligase C-terminal domain-containing protein, partial [Firmicutes bacterium]|nr:His/Gly/Thr/Pro-type tRNA ligase C-terminal domain-containing protein [Bacillota bacterium]